ncbi:hypothetical protein GCM10023149_34100 [Mucilaginibacter gynuensis]|uniref:Peptidase M56 domain-containing protein n=1 Tax=Mucilaginibacter gynuensis TaxID=1302236 RepID=A0ABP8GSV1_9SPHI
MPALITYILKLSLCLSAIYLFYYLVLRRLTFYNWNRWYLAGYSLLSFAIPFINVSPMVQKVALKEEAINYIPAIQNIAAGKQTGTIVQDTGLHLDAWDMLMAAILLGITVMAIRIVMQLISFNRIKKRAVLLNDDSDTPIYHVDEQIMPFSFGKSIYINREMHTEQELEEIILHEYVHVVQKHTIDIFIGECLCALNWYNPFAWLIRHSIRQNLEFIADNEVLNAGLDKKAYQYHLLKVVGIPKYRIANQFNFSSLKKRIMMMNKVRTAKIHLLKFMFVLPLLAVILLACRNKLNTNDNGIKYAVIFYDLETYKPIPDVEVKGIYKPVDASSEGDGYITVPYTVGKDNTLHVSLKFNKQGYIYAERRFAYPFNKEKPSSLIELIGLRKTASKNCKSCYDFLATMSTAIHNDSLNTEAWAFYKSYKGFRSKAVKVMMKRDSAEKADTIVKQKAVPATQLIAQDSVITDKTKGRITLVGNAVYNSADIRLMANVIQIEDSLKTLKNALILINNKETTFNELKKMSAQKLQTVFIFGPAKAQPVFGERGINGVVEVKTFAADKKAAVKTNVSATQKVYSTTVLRADSLTWKANMKTAITYGALSDKTISSTAPQYPTKLNSAVNKNPGKDVKNTVFLTADSLLWKTSNKAIVLTGHVIQYDSQNEAIIKLDVKHVNIRASFLVVNGNEAGEKPYLLGKDMAWRVTPLNKEYAQNKYGEKAGDNPMELTAVRLN